MDDHGEPATSLLGELHKVRKYFDLGRFSSPPLPAECLGSNLNKSHHVGPIQIGRQHSIVGKAYAEGLDFVSANRSNCLSLLDVHRNTAELGNIRTGIAQEPKIDIGQAAASVAASPTQHLRDYPIHYFNGLFPRGRGARG